MSTPLILLALVYIAIGLFVGYFSAIIISNINKRGSKPLDVVWGVTAGILWPVVISTIILLVSGFVVVETHRPHPKGLLVFYTAVYALLIVGCVWFGVPVVGGGLLAIGVVLVTTGKRLRDLRSTELARRPL